MVSYGPMQWFKTCYDGLIGSKMLWRNIFFRIGWDTPQKRQIIWSVQNCIYICFYVHIYIYIPMYIYIYTPFARLWSLFHFDKRILSRCFDPQACPSGWSYQPHIYGHKWNISSGDLTYGESEFWERVNRYISMIDHLFLWAMASHGKITSYMDHQLVIMNDWFSKGNHPQMTEDFSDFLLDES